MLVDAIYSVREFSGSVNSGFNPLKGAVSVGPSLNKLQKRRFSAVFLFVLGIVGDLEGWGSACGCTCGVEVGCRCAELSSQLESQVLCYDGALE